MEALISLAVLFLFLGAGMLGARFGIIPEFGRIESAVGIALRGLLFFMGVRIGLLNIDGSQMRAIGILSVGYAVITVIGTVIAILLFQRIFRVAMSGHSGVPLERNTRDISIGRQLIIHLGEPLRLFVYVIAGILGAVFLPFFSLIPDAVGTWLLYLLLFLIGVQLVRGDINIPALLKTPGMILLPAATAIGSVGAGVLAAPLFGISPGTGAALSAGFGWYSLSGVIISDMGSPLLGSAGFLINLIRETIALFTIPLLGRVGMHGMAIGVGGATSMDVTLPLVERSCGDRYVPLSIAHGALLSLLVPFLVPLFFGWA
jgi:uncharacterized membrane protein YbjE (DUF340 family)